jgi:hypothetical protein
VSKVLESTDTYTPAFPKPGNRRRKDAPTGPKIPEAVIQEQAESYCDLIGVEKFHFPAQILNAAFHMRQMSGGEIWAAREASSKIKGFPDLIMFYKGYYKAVELKSVTGVISQHQQHWIKRLDGVVCKSFEAFRGVADAWKAECDLRDGVK